jgi:hypothetical protein
VRLGRKPNRPVAGAFQPGALHAIPDQQVAEARPQILDAGRRVFLNAVRCDLLQPAMRYAPGLPGPGFPRSPGEKMNQLRSIVTAGSYT